MKNIIAGTAGHIDHGKTALVRALTGIDADRLEEEKRRGITIDLGFAHLQLTPQVRVGFIDVPGHERFVKNMLAGAGGIDLVLFVIAADESIKPQTREHFDICRLLGISKGIVVLTKADVVDRDILELARLEAEEFVAGSFLEGAPIVPVSSTTGEGIDQLKKALERAALEVSEKNASRHFRLPIDRVFSMKGFGTVITGTLISGAVKKDQEVEIHPSGRLARVRGVQVYGAAAEQATAGQRTALNLADVEPLSLARGMLLTLPGLFQSTREFDCELELLASAKPLKDRAPVHFHAGSAEIEAEVRLLEGVLKPGTKAFARVMLREPAMLLPGDRFITRMFSPVITIGGGVVLDNAGVRYRKRANLAARLRALSEAKPAGMVAILVRESGFGMSLGSLIARTGMVAREIESIAAAGGFVTLRQPELWVMDAEWFRSALEKLAREVREFHQANPLAPGIAKQDLRGRLLPAAAPPFVLEALLAAAKQIAVDGDTVRLATHKLVLREDEEQARGAIERAFEQAGLAVPALPDVMAKSGVELKRARSILQILLRDKKLVRVTDELVFHHSAIETLRALLSNHRSQRFSVPTFKDWTGISRKYAIPLLEFLDRERVTRREGDERIVL